MNTLSNFNVKEAHEIFEKLANQATQSLVAEARFNRSLRTEIGRISHNSEQQMILVTNCVNTYCGSI